MRLTLAVLGIVPFAPVVVGQQKAPAPQRSSQQKRAPAAASAPQQATVTSTAKHPMETLQVEGAVKLSPEKIIAASGLKIGQLVGIEDFDVARDRLSATGAFENIGYRFTPSKNGQIGRAHV